MGDKSDEEESYKVGKHILKHKWQYMNWKKMILVKLKRRGLLSLVTQGIYQRQGNKSRERTEAAAVEIRMDHLDFSYHNIVNID